MSVTNSSEGYNELTTKNNLNFFGEEKSVAGTFIAFYVFFMILILFGNVLVIVVVVLRKALKTTTNYYIVSLCISDIAVGLFAVPDDIMAHYDENFMNVPMCKAMEFVVHVALCSNIYSVLCIALDRFRAVVYPFSSKYAKKQCIISITTVWVFSFLYSIRVLFWYDLVNEEYIANGKLTKYYQCAIPNSAKKLVHDFVMVDLFMVYLIPLVVINIIHAIIIRKMHMDSIKIAPHNKERKLRQKKIIKMLIVIVILFSICQLPTNIYNIYRYWKGVFKGFIIVHEICDLITFSNSWLNVIVYVILNDNFARHLKRMLRLKRGGTSLDQTVGNEAGYRENTEQTTKLNTGANGGRPSTSSRTPGNNFKLKVNQLRDKRSSVFVIEECDTK